MFMIRTSKASLQVDKEVFFERGFVSLKPPQNTGKTNASGTIVTVGGAGGTKATNEIRTYVRTRNTALLMLKTCPGQLKVRTYPHFGTSFCVCDIDS